MFNLNISAKYAHSIKTLYLEQHYSYEERNNPSPDYVEKINGLGEIIAKCGKTLKLPGQSRIYGRWSKKDSMHKVY